MNATMDYCTKQGYVIEGKKCSSTSAAICYAMRVFCMEQPEAESYVRHLFQVYKARMGV